MDTDKTFVFHRLFYNIEVRIEFKTLVFKMYNYEPPESLKMRNIGKLNALERGPVFTDDIRLLFLLEDRVGVEKNRFTPDKVQL